MKNTLSNVLIFTVGAAIGSAVTWKLVKTKYEQIAQEEIDSVKAAFDRRVEPENDHNEKVVSEDVTKSIDIPVQEPEETYDDSEANTVYENMLRELKYNTYSSTSTPIEIPDMAPEGDGPRIITPDEFDDLGYKIVELTYWGDNILTDSKNKRIQDVDALIGKGTIEQFGKYEEDCLHVRDDAKKIDFEILRDLKKYSDFFGDENPHSAEDQ